MRLPNYPLADECARFYTLVGDYRADALVGGPARVGNYGSGGAVAVSANASGDAAGLARATASAADSTGSLLGGDAEWRGVGCDGAGRRLLAFGDERGDATDSGGGVGAGGETSGSAGEDSRAGEDLGGGVGQRHGDLLQWAAGGDEVCDGESSPDLLHV